jgi:hypothetical protein
MSDIDSRTVPDFAIARLLPGRNIVCIGSILPQMRQKVLEILRQVFNFDLQKAFALGD